MQILSLLLTIVGALIGVIGGLVGNIPLILIGTLMTVMGAIFQYLIAKPFTPFGSPWDLVGAEPTQEPKRAKIDAVGTFSFGLSSIKFQWFFLRRINEIKPIALVVS
jgi:hypothetical protein